MSLREALIQYEGLRLKPYYDSVGKLTIGVGRNLNDVGIFYDEAMAMLDHDIARCTNECMHALPWFADLADEKQQVVLQMCFNLGLSRLMGFRRFLAAMEQGNYETAAAEMLDSLWAKQVGRRALDLAAMLQRSENV